jgi:carbonic anhydrase
MELIFESGMIRIRAINEKTFGTLSYADGEQVYEAYEIVFHTPGEHSVDKKFFEMEV